MDASWEGIATVAESELQNSSITDLENVARATLAELATRPDVTAINALLAMGGYVGECTSVSAQTLSTSMSWAQIGDLAGTSRQNAWSRWSS